MYRAIFVCIPIRLEIQTIGTYCRLNTHAQKSMTKMRALSFFITPQMAFLMILKVLSFNTGYTDTL